MNATRLSALAGFFGPLIYFLVFAYTGYKDPSFSFIRDWSAELGASGAPYATIFNFVGLLPLGVCLMLFSLAFWKGMRGGKRVIAATVLMLMIGAMIVLLAFNPCDAQCSRVDMSPVAVRHLLLTHIIYPATVLMTGLIGSRYFNRKEMPGYQGFSFATFVLLAFGYILLLIQLKGFGGMGAVQSAMLVAFVYWVWVSVRVIRCRLKEDAEAALLSRAATHESEVQQDHRLAPGRNRVAQRW